MRLRAQIVACALALAVSAPTAALPQEDSIFERNWGIALLSKSDSETLQAIGHSLRQTMARYAEPENADPRWDAYRANLQRSYDNVRRVLADRGVRIPGIVVSGSTSGAAGAAATGANAGNRSGSNTQAIEQPKPRGGDTQPMTRPSGDTAAVRGPSLVLPLTVVLTAAQLAECTLRGVPASKCAVDLALKTAGGLAVGQLVTVLSASGNAVVSALATGAGIGLGTAAVGGAVITTVYAGVQGVSAASAELDAQRAEALLREQQTQNAQRLTPAAIDRLVQQFSREATVVRDKQQALTRAAALPENANQKLVDLVASARAALEEFQRLNEAVAMASTMCANPANNPAAAAVRAEQAAARTRAATDRAAALIDNARTLSTPCDAKRAAAANAALASARAQLDAAMRSNDDVRDAVRESALFFSMVRSSRDASDKAAQQVAVLERLLADARIAANELTMAAAQYRGTRDTLLTAHAQFEASVRGLQDAFGADAPASVKASLATINRLVPPTGRALSNDELRRMNEAVDTEVNRISGLLRTAQQKKPNVSACAQIADAMPAQLKTLLDTVAAESSRDAARANAASTAAQEISRDAAQCMVTMPLDVSGRSTASWGGAWTIDIGTMSLTPTNDAAARAALSTKSAFGPAIACAADSIVLNGELTIRPWTWIAGAQPVSASVVACATGDQLTARFSNQTRLTPQDAATGLIRAGHFSLTLYHDNRSAFLGRWQRWNPIALENMGGESPIGGKKQ